MKSNKSALAKKYFIENGQFKDKNVFLRVDYSVPVEHSNDNNCPEILDSYRIDISLHTLTSILSKCPHSLILGTHFGRPEGKEMKYSTRFLIPYLEKKLGKKVTFLEE